MGKCKSKAIQTDLGAFRHNQAYSEPCVTMGYLEPWHIQNPGIFRTRSIYRALVYSGPRIFRTLTYLKSEAYSEPCKTATI